MSLRDQFLKSGLVTKQQAKKAARKSKKKQHDQIKGKEISEEDIRLQKEIERKRKEQRERDQKLNQERERARLEHEKAVQASEIIMTHDLSEPARIADERYYFVFERRFIRSIEVTEPQLNQLANGKLAIATTGDEQFYLINADDCLKVLNLKPEFIICWHQETQQTGS